MAELDVAGRVTTIGEDMERGGTFAYQKYLRFENCTGKPRTRADLVSLAKSHLTPRK